MRRKLLCALLAALMLLVAGCSGGAKIVPIDTLSPAQTQANVYTPAPTQTPQAQADEPLVVARIEESGMSVGTRINPPMGYTRDYAAESSFSAFLRKYPVRVAGADVMLYDGTARQDAQAAAVLDVTLGKKNHEGPAGAMARLIAEYLYDQEDYVDISFTIGKNFAFTFDKWRQGNELKSSGNDLEWTGGGEDSNSEENFKAYLSTLFVYISMNTLRKDLTQIEDVDGDEIQVGDIYIAKNADDRELAVMVADICRNDETGERLMLLVQGGSPAQQLHIVDNPTNAAIAPWYPCGFTSELSTPDLTLDVEKRYRFTAFMDEE